MLNKSDMELLEFIRSRKPFPSLPDYNNKSAEWEKAQFLMLG